MKLIELINLLPDADIPCDGCTICCYGTIVPLLDDEDFPSVEVDGQRVLPHGDDGNCIYLTEDGCGAWPNSPRSCRTYDCVAATKAGLEARPEVREKAHQLAEYHDPEIHEALASPIDFRI